MTDIRRGGPLLRMGTSAVEWARKWGNTPLLPLVLGEEGDETFDISNGDDETVKKVKSGVNDCINDASGSRLTVLRRKHECLLRRKNAVSLSKEDV